MNINNGILYFQQGPACEVVSCSVEFDSDFPIDEQFPLKMTSCYEAELSIKLNRLLMLSMIYQRKITNNWLKLHGGVMTRRCGRRMAYENTSD